MALNTYLKHDQKSTGTTALSGSAPQTGAGNTLSAVAIRLAVNTLSANLVAQATTNTLTITGKWQVSNDGSTWVDCFPSNNAAQVTVVTGTGSAVSSTRCVAAPECVYGKPFIRYVVVTGVTTAGTGDQFIISYNWRAEN